MTFAVLARQGALLIVQRYTYAPATVAVAVELPTVGVLNVVVPGPLTWLHAPVPLVGLLPPNPPLVSVPQRSWFGPTVAVVGEEVTVSVAAFEFVVPPLFVNTARYWLLFWDMFDVNDRVVFVAPLISVQVEPPFVLTCHWTEGFPPFAVDVKLAVDPAQTFCEVGCCVMFGGFASVK